MDATTRYELLAAAFHRETGLWAPGKDVPAELATDYTERTIRWGEWLHARRDAVLSGAASRDGEGSHGG